MYINIIHIFIKSFHIFCCLCVSVIGLLIIVVTWEDQDTHTHTLMCVCCMYVKYAGVLVLHFKCIMNKRKAIGGGRHRMRRVVTVPPEEGKYTSLNYFVQNILMVFRCFSTDLLWKYRKTYADVSHC